MPLLHGPGEDGRPEFARQFRRQACGEENPDVTTMARARAFKDGGHFPLGTGVEECPHIVLPGRVVEVSSEKPTSFVCQQRINANCEFADQMVVEDLVSQREVFLGFVRLRGAPISSVGG